MGGQRFKAGGRFNSRRLGHQRDAARRRERHVGRRRTAMSFFGGSGNAKVTTYFACKDVVDLGVTR